MFFYFFWRLILSSNIKDLNVKPLHVRAPLNLVCIFFFFDVFYLYYLYYLILVLLRYHTLLCFFILLHIISSTGVWLNLCLDVAGLFHETFGPVTRIAEFWSMESIILSAACKVICMYVLGVSSLEVYTSTHMIQTRC